MSATRKILGPSTILQAALPDILENVPNSYVENTMNVVQVRKYYFLYISLLVMHTIIPRK